MARLGGLFHLFRIIPKAFTKRRFFYNALHEFRRRLPSPVKNSTAQNWHKAALKILAQDPFRFALKTGTSSTRRHAISKVERSSIRCQLVTDRTAERLKISHQAE